MEIPLLVIVVRISIHSRPWLLINFSPHCCLTQPEDTLWIKLRVYIDDITTSATLLDTTNGFRNSFWQHQWHQHNLHIICNERFHRNSYRNNFLCPRNYGKGKINGEGTTVNSVWQKNIEIFWKLTIVDTNSWNVSIQKPKQNSAENSSYPRNSKANSKFRNISWVPLLVTKFQNKYSL
jgi:hypothetical protein